LINPDTPSNKALTSFGFSGIGLEINLLPKEFMKSRSQAFAMVAGICFFFGCSPRLSPPGHYQDSPIDIDGNISDWGFPLRFSNPEYNMEYEVSNDKKNMYICVYSKDISMQKRILKSGMIIYFDPKGEKNKNMSLVFPVKKPVDPSTQRTNEPIRYTDYMTEMNRLLRQSDYYNTTGLLNMENGQYALDSKINNIQVAIKLNGDSSLVYEAAIPINYLLGSDLKAGYKPGNFSVGIVVNKNQSQNGNSGYRPHNGYGGGGMRMHGMGGNRNYGPANNTASKPEENWDTFQLVLKK
jgi:hypothetical protein